MERSNYLHRIGVKLEKYGFERLNAVMFEIGLFTAGGNSGVFRNSVKRTNTGSEEQETLSGYTGTAPVGLEAKLLLKIIM